MGAAAAAWTPVAVVGAYGGRLLLPLLVLQGSCSSSRSISALLQQFSRLSHALQTVWFGVAFVTFRPSEPWHRPM